MQPTRYARHAAETTTLRRGLALFLLLTLAGSMAGCGRSPGLSAAGDPRSGACDHGLLAVGAWKCLSGDLQTTNLAADPAADRTAGQAGKAAAESARP